MPLTVIITMVMMILMLLISMKKKIGWIINALDGNHVVIFLLMFGPRARCILVNG